MLVFSFTFFKVHASDGLEHSIDEIANRDVVYLDDFGKFVQLTETQKKAILNMYKG